MIWLLGGYMWLFIHRPFEVWPVLGTLQIERAYMICTLLVWVITPGKGFHPNRNHIALMLFACAILFTWLASPYANLPAPLDTVENYFKIAVFYVLLITTVRTEKDLRLIVLIYLGVMTVYLGHSFREFLCGRYEARMGIRRMLGVDKSYGDPNGFAAAILCALPMTWPFWAERPRRVPLLFLLGFTGLGGLCILLTGSRTGFLGLLLFGVITLLLFARQKVQALLMVGAAAMVFFALIAVALPDKLQNRYMTIVDSSYGPANAVESAHGRVEGFWTGVELWQRSPLVGQGPGAYMVASGSEHQPHNLYGQVLGEMGLVGAFALGFLCLCIYFNWLDTNRLEKQRVRSDSAADPAVTLLPGRVERPAPSLPYLVSRSVAITAVMLLIMGLAGHNLYRFQWQWFAGFQAIAVGCLRVRVSNAARAAAYASPYLILPRVRRPSSRRPEVPPAPQW